MDNIKNICKKFNIPENINAEQVINLLLLAIEHNYRTFKASTHDELLSEVLVSLSVEYDELERWGMTELLNGLLSKIQNICKINA